MTEKGFDLNLTTILILTHVKSKKILKMNEVYQYSALQFIGDSGGTIGVFVGMSFYSIYLDLMEFFKAKISSKNNIGPSKEWINIMAKQGEKKGEKIKLDLKADEAVSSN